MSRPSDEDRLIDRFIAADEEIMAPVIDVLRDLHKQNALLKVAIDNLLERVERLEGKT